MEDKIEAPELNPPNGRILISSGFSASLWFITSDLF
jgi:hypothetical protein